LSEDQVVLVTSIRVACGVRVVAVEIDLAPYAFFSETLFRGFDEAFQYPFACAVVCNDVIETVTFGCCIFGVAADVKVEPLPVLEEYIRGSSPADNSTKQIPSDLVR